MPDNFVTLSNVEIGIDSPSGLAVRIRFEGEWEWVPYSQLRALHRDKRVVGNDSIEVAAWLAQERGWV